MSVTDLRARQTLSDAEWETRCNLAALYRVLHHYRMTDLIFTHLSARVPGEEGTFLINRYGEMFDEVTASSLVKMDMDGNVIGEPGNFNQAGFNIHSGTYLAREDVNCVIHTHTKAGVAVSETRSGLLPVSQHALIIYGDVSHYDYGGPGSTETPEEIGAGCGQSNCVIMRNHGLMAMGPTIPAAFFRIYYLEQSCAIQASAQAMGGNGEAGLQPVSEAVLAKSLTHFSARLQAEDLGQREWTSVLRMLERQGTEYRV